MIAIGQKIDTISKLIQINEVVVSANKTEQNKRFVAQQIQTITLKEIQLQNYQNTADMLGNSGVVTIQKSQQGGGSITIRGFEASRVLLIIDGVRMNNLIYRAGHLQNVLTIDENILARADVICGSYSTVYGSDALGGVIYLQTAKPKLKYDEGKIFTGNAYFRYGSANKEKKGHIDFNLAGEKWALLTSFTYSDFGDLRMGSNKNGDNDLFGGRKYYVERVNNVDVVVANTDSLIQKFTAYKQYDMMQKFLFQQSENMSHDINIQFSTSSNVPRYDRLTDPKGAGLANAEWYYGPQLRLLAGYNFNGKNVLGGQKLHIGLHYQNVEESRHQRKFNNNGLQHRVEKVSSINLNVDLNKNIGNGQLNYGLEIQSDNLKSTAEKEDITTGIKTALDTRYPNGDNKMVRTDVYATYSYKWNEKSALNAGFRGGYATLHSTLNDATFFKLPYSVIDQKNVTYSGSLGVVNNPSENFKLSANVSTGFRVPNIDDLAKIFETAKGTLIVPNEDLKPEKTVTFDAGITVWKSNRLQWENVAYFTQLFDAIVTTDFQYNGQSTVLYDGVVSQVVANQNLRKAYICGFSSNLKSYIIDYLMFYAGVNYTYGRINGDAGETPIDHIPPVYGKIGIHYEAQKIGADVYVLFSGKKDISDYYLNGEDNEQYAPSSGMPGWKTLNVKASYNVLKYLTLQAGVENILDTRYRTFSSGMNSAGRNIFGTLRFKF